MRISPLALLFALGASPLAAQTPAPAIPPQPAQVGPTATLSLQEAQQLARRNNPVLQQTVGAVRSAHAQLRSAYGAFLPNADVSFGSQYREGRPQFFNGQTIGATSATMSSSYDLNVQARYNAATFIGPKLQRANVRAAEADVESSAEQLRADVSQQYLTVLQQQARASLQDTLLTNARLQLELAKARAAVGSGTALDVRRAEVAVGQQQVALLQARNQVEIEKLRLFQRMGVDQPANVVLTTEFPIEPLTQSVDQLLEMARRGNPTLNAVRSRQSAADLGYRSAQSQYTPTLSLYTGWGGYTSEFTDKGFVANQALRDKQSPCIQSETILSIAQERPADYSACQAITLTSAEQSQALSANNQYPFTFQRNPWQVQASLSIPIFNGFVREQRVQEAAVARNNARYNVRAQELALTAGVTGAYLTLNAAQQTVAIQEQNAKTARDALTLAEERYRVGVATFVDVQQARADFERAENDRINAIYDYHKAFAGLESAVGRPLR
jgi:outer membrane protein